MSKLFDRLDARKAKDAKILSAFVGVYCRENHREQTKAMFQGGDPRLTETLAGKELMLCKDCQNLLNHGIAKLLLCKYDPKPSCKKCPTHCYAPGYREKMRRVMRFSGIYLVRHGRLDLLWHYWF